MPDAKAKEEITREQFFTFLEWLNPDHERAAEEYERLRSLLCHFFSLRGCNFADELADETINRVILKSCETEIDNVSAYCYGVARNVYRESLRKQRVHVDIEDVTIAAKPPEAPSFSSECLDKCLEKLSPEHRDLVLDYFSREKMAKINLRARLSASLKKTQTAVRMQVVRTKRKLKICIQECMS
ncbi:MAG TPA: hypothetical protein VF290_28640 [Pyrinomonadaceae bacterium]